MKKKWIMFFVCTEPILKSNLAKKFGSGSGFQVKQVFIKFAQQKLVQ